MRTAIVPAGRPELAPIALPEVGPVDVLDAFLSGRNPRTLRAYDRDLRDFARAIGQPDARTAVEFLLSQPHGRANARALSYKNHLIGRGLKSATVARYLSALRSVVTLARTLGRIHWALDVESPRIEPYRDTKGPGDAGWYLMLVHAQAAAEHRTPLALRNLAILRTIHDLALRRSELVSLDLDSFDPDAQTLAIFGKGRTDPTQYSIPDPTAAALSDWIGVRGVWPGPLFIRLDRAATEGATRLTADGVYLLVQQLGRRAGVKRPVWPHALRHQAITSLLDRTNGNTRMAQKFSRHCDPRTLLKYDDTRKDLFGEAARIVAD